LNSVHRNAWKYQIGRIDFDVDKHAGQTFVEVFDFVYELNVVVDTGLVGGNRPSRECIKLDIVQLARYICQQVLQLVDHMRIDYDVQGTGFQQQIRFEFRIFKRLAFVQKLKTRHVFVGLLLGRTNELLENCFAT
jgi:hypothetical protein